MQIDKIQASQPSFGTTIKADYHVLDHYKSYGRYIFDNMVKQLENNGRNDVFVLSSAPHVNGINAFSYEIKPAKNGYGKYLASNVINFKEWHYVPGKRNIRYQNLVEIYNKCYEDMIKSERPNVEKMGAWSKFMI